MIDSCWSGEDEAEEVHYIFNCYAELKSVPKLVDDLASQDFRTRDVPCLMERYWVVITSEQLLPL